jgi:opacity protein-like surface antigen
MLKKFLKIVLITPVLMTGVLCLAQEKQVKPNIRQLTSDKSSKKANEEIQEESAPSRIPGELNKHSLGIGVGQTFLRSSLAENGNDKITGEVYYNYSASYSFDFMANAHWSTHNYLNREATIRGLALAIKAKGFQVDAFSPFVFGGFGFYYPSVTRAVSSTELATTRSQLVFGVNAGAGVELRLNSKIVVGAILHYHDPFDVRQDIGGALETSYVKILLTALYTFN